MVFPIPPHSINKTKDNALFLVETENLRIIPKVTCSPAVK